jgi:hypothetical protein
MPSRYDEPKKCRVGTMDDAQFDTECQAENRKSFRAILAAWTKAGGSLEWGAGGVGPRGRVDGKEVGVGFLAPAFAGKPDRIELALTQLGKAIGQARCERLADALRAAAGEAYRGQTMVAIVEPGKLKDGGRALTQTFCGLLDR